MGPVSQALEHDKLAIQELCRQIVDGLQAAGGCPRCSMPLTAEVSLDAVTVRCPTGCFQFSYRREPLTGQFVSGTLEMPEEGNEAAFAETVGKARPEQGLRR